MKELRILLLEDSDTDLLFLQKADSNGVSFHTTHVKRLSEGIDAIKNAAFDVLLLDLGLSESRGFETFRVLHRLCPMTPIVVLTAADEEEVGERALEEGAEDYLIKGQVNKAVLFRSLHCAILRHRFLNKVSYEGESVRKSEFQLRQLVAAREASREAERTRVSRDLHNYSEQFLSAIKMDLVWAGHRLIESPRVEVNIALGERLAETQGLVDRTIESLQKIALELRPNVLDHLGLADALKDEARRFEKRTKIGVNLELYESLSKLHVDTTTTLFRICQELLAGISTQSQASIIDVFLNVDGPFLELRVKDNEAGLKWVTSLEILGVRERAYSLGGEIKFEITPHVGTEAIVRVPLRLA